MHNSQLGPGRTADWVDGVSLVGKVYIAGCVSARRVYSARVCVSVGVTDCQYEHVTRVRIFSYSSCDRVKMAECTVVK